MIATPNQISMVLGGEIKSVAKDHENFSAILKALKSNKFSQVPKLIAPVVAAKGVSVVRGVAFFNGRELHNSLARRVIQMAEEKKPLGVLSKFIELLEQNPVESARNELYDFLDANYQTIPLTPEGYFVAYKRVDANLNDQYSHTFDNRVGKTVSVPEEDVDRYRNRTCSHGLHVAAPGYMPHYSGENVILVVVNPKHVRAVPADYNQMKMRVTQYRVISVFDSLDEALSHKFGSTVVMDRRFYLDALKKKRGLKWERLVKTATVRLAKLYDQIEAAKK